MTIMQKKKNIMNNILLEIKNVEKHFDSIKALRGVSLTLYKGEIVSLLGVNGAGKTTLSSIIVSLHPPTSGDIVFNSKSIYSNLIEYRKHIGYCPQKPNLNNYLTLEENLRFAGRYFGLDDKVIAERIKELSTQFELDKYLKRNSDILSGGYKQRFMIARSLMHNPSLLVLDEPTVGLDPQVRHQLWDYIKKLKASGMTILLTTHYLDEAEYLSDRVCVLDKGLIKLIDTPANLMASFKKTRLEDVFVQLTNEPQE